LGKTLLARLRDLNGSSRSSPVRQPVETAALPDTLLRRVWPKLHVAGIWVFVSVCIVCRLLANARLVDVGLAFRVTLCVGGVALILALIEAIFERLKLVAPSKPSQPLIDEDDIPVFRPPPPLRETTPDADQARPRAAPVGGALPGRIAGPGRTATWRLEGDYRWKPDDDPPSPGPPSPP
jgi:hypothetical protein